MGSSLKAEMEGKESPKEHTKSPPGKANPPLDPDNRIRTEVSYGRKEKASIFPAIWLK
jgi:hypothetical protein